MLPELAIAAVVGLLVVGGLAFQDAVVERVAAVGRDPELSDREDLD